LTAEDHSKALKYLTQALEKDPKFVQPYGELLVLYGWCMLPGVSTDQERLKETKRIAAKLMAIDPNLALGHAALSFSHYLERDWPGAEQEIRRAIAAEPDFAIAHFIYCFYLTLEGRTAEAEREALRAQALEPPASARVSAIAAAWPFMAERRYDRAITQLQQVLDLDRNFAMGHDYLGDCYEAQSNYVAALEEYKSFALLSGNDPRKVAEVFGAIRQAYDTQGEQGYLRKWIEVMLADEAQPQDQQMFANQSDSDLAGYYARVGEKQKALEDLEKHFDGPNVWSQINFLPAYDSLHDEPRFKALVKRAGLGK